MLVENKSIEDTIMDSIMDTFFEQPSNIKECHIEIQRIQRLQQLFFIPYFILVIMGGSYGYIWNVFHVFLLTIAVLMTILFYHKLTYKSYRNSVNVVISNL